MDPELLSLLFGGIPGMTGSAAAMPVTPPVAGTGPMALPPTLAPMLPRPVEPYMTDPLMSGSPAPQMPAMPSQPASLGASLDPTVPIPRPRPPEAPGGTYGTQNATTGVNDPSRIAAAMKGIIAPPAPVSQKVGTPHAPPLGRLQDGHIAELLASLGIGPQQAFPGLKLPSTLGQALSGGR